MLQHSVDFLQVVQPSVSAVGRRRLSRKMLDNGELQLSGSGVSAGNDVVGEQANAYGHGEPGEPLPSVSNTHIQVSQTLSSLRSLG